MNTLSIPKATDSLETWLSYLEQAHSKPIDMGLDRIRKVATELDLLKPAPYVITVAGTNGKGSTCRLLEVTLLKAGFRVGVYSSPHLIHYNERVRINGEVLPDADHVQAFAKINAKKTASLTYFEFSTLSAFELFKQNQLDIVILEVGLGGRLDATNIIDPSLAVITSIDIDHVAFLGDNREDIGREKAGIFRENIPVVIGEPDCPHSIKQIADSLNCHAFYRGKDWQFEIKNNLFHWYSEEKSFTDLPIPLIPIPNAGTALAVLMQLPFEIDEKIIRQALNEAQMTGRFQTLTDTDFTHFSQPKPAAKVIIDVGHNPHAARYLADKLRELKQPNQKIYAVFSALEDKDLSGIVEPLANIIDEWHCAGLDCWRGQTGEAVLAKLVNVLPNSTACSYENVAQASRVLFETANENDIVLVFGSFHTVADFMLWLET
ncbi:bifunctional tetrahydrofolate synthase/dihydrofolate synthase [Mannheimia haemolytica]|uniref:bifunctional tetrahydrofolate synthase/dihydrofolate synthase n=1 Tax=Mannheimia haemolytica TaxID=75985 RepID=UPI000588BDF8|nr:bifunctional tetrahydrofolate synthase/dihydrofolate synthase [Mannheimia haemolytica]AJE08082.1 bifunctional tetrahydrofolate synthase/dihydrofolate synthase [Mannheimia haemolytica USDA-ARS-USMARC-184]KYL06650.1 folylpolyglutamate synthase [Mannheimia haemolytica]UFK41940.1 bifunctional tetrahydrofolate synthase/dihydrofolate synthase [Mannheimia haemolytica]UQX63982.1 bifunctional tetrahydrofolate synthase/dihydrofolate synthase [Mannheimia haemolytica]UQX80954.1 bifunctional tetrahydrof